MSAEHAASPPHSFLFRYPSTSLIVTTLALLAGQAFAASPLHFPPIYLSLLLIPLPFIFWRAGLAWAILCLGGKKGRVGDRRNHL